MSRRSRITVSLAPAFSLVVAAAAFAQQEPARAFVLDPEALQVASLNLEDGSVLARADLEGQPERLLISPDGTRLVVLDKGPGKQTVRFGYHPTAESWATVIDATTMQVLRRSRLCWTVSAGVVFESEGFAGDFLFSPDGRQLTLACLGYTSQKPEETLPRALVTLGLETGEEVARAGVERTLDALLLAPDGTVIVFSGLQKADKKRPRLPALLQFLKLEGLEPLARLELDGDPGRPTLSPDGRYLYLLEFGAPDRKPEKNVDGRVQVVSLESRAHEGSIEVGSAPRGLIVDDVASLTYVLADGPPSPEKKKDEKSGLLTAMRGAELRARVTVGSQPLFARISPDRQRMYVVGAGSLASVDLLGLDAVSSGGIKADASWLLPYGKGTVTELAIANDGRRGYALYEGSSKLGVVDLDEGKMLAEVNTGRGGIKFLKVLGAAAATMGSYAAGQSAAEASGSSVFFYQVYGVAPTNTSLVIRPDQKFVYVLNSKSNDVSMLDAGTLTAEKKIGVGGNANRLELLPGGAYVAVRTGSDTLHLIDTATNEKVSELGYGGNFALSPDERFAIAFEKGNVHCLKGHSLERVGTATGFEKPIQVVFPPPPGALPVPPARDEVQGER